MSNSPSYPSVTAITIPPFGIRHSRSRLPPPSISVISTLAPSGITGAWGHDDPACTHSSTPSVSVIFYLPPLSVSQAHGAAMTRLVHKRLLIDVILPDFSAVAANARRRPDSEVCVNLPPHHHTLAVRFETSVNLLPHWRCAVNRL
eukprot:scaffold9050_cov80-Isochrysis_galbana.AAC.2